MAQADAGTGAIDRSHTPVASNDVTGGSLHSATPVEVQVETSREDFETYRPSWVDALADRVRRLPVPAWVVYFVSGLALTLLFVVSELAYGSSLAEAITLETVLAGSSGVYALALLHYLDNWAGTALKQYRPVMRVEEPEYRRLHYRFTTLPARQTLVATVIGIFYGVLGWFVFEENPIEGGEPSSLLLFVYGLNAIIYILSYMLIVVMVYHTIHQLRLVNLLYTHYTRINLFQLGPLYALSGLAARTAIGLAIPTYLWVQVNTTTATKDTAATIFESAFLGLVIVATFVWPLWGAHRLLQQEKQRLKDAAASRVEATIAELHTRVDSRDLRDGNVLKDVLDGLVTEQGLVDKLPTWPWQPELARGVGAAFLLPLFIWFVQRLLERLGF
ncbi:MAG: hypothetical protein M3437_04480 [Chloroflexota bacterium]|nr:hypothetical protein [Chloroflexota bacterium]MDQ5867367.1 hypothetical protein [Chloroflexota bacterium]